MARKPATTADLTVGGTVFTSRTGRIARTVTALEDQPAYPDAGPVVYARRPETRSAMEMAFAVSELWVEVPR